MIGHSSIADPKRLTGTFADRHPRMRDETLLGRLAVDRHWSGQGLGSALLADALQRVVRASAALAVYAIVVDAKDEQARAFYEHFGFIGLPGKARRLFYPVDGIR